MYATMLMKKDADLGGMVNPALAGRFGHDQQMLTGSSIAPGFNLAAHYKFNDEWAAGLTYRSRVKQAVRGIWNLKTRIRFRASTCPTPICTAT